MKAYYTPEIIHLGDGDYDNLSIPQSGGKLFICESCTSTLDVAWDLNKKNLLSPWDSVFATEQTAGRGQLRREWISPTGNLYATLCLPMGLHGPAASVSVGWLVVKALFGVLSSFVSRAELSDLKLKWPNDVLLHKHKIGGILLEEKGNVLMSGIGINFLSAPGIENLRENFALPAATLQSLIKNNDFSKNISAETLWLSLVSMMRFWYEIKVPLRGGEISKSLIEPELAFLGDMVRICDFSEDPSINLKAGESRVNQELTGRIVGLGPNAELKLNASGEEILLVSGSIYPLQK